MSFLNTQVLVRFRHSGANRVNEIADPMTLASVQKTLVGFGFLEECAFDSALRAASHQRKRD